MIAPQIFLARFRPDLAELGKLKVYTLDFPYFNIIGNFLDKLVQLNPERKKRKYPFTWDECPPFRQINSVLVATTPTLVHAFEEYGYDANWYGHMKFKSRRLMALGVAPDGSEPWRPSRTQIDEIVYEWIRLWVETKFSEELKLRGMKPAYEELLECIWAAPGDWCEYTICELWERNDYAVYDALPSTIAALFVARRQTLRSTLLQSNNKELEIHWCLTQHDDTKLAVVSEPQEWRDGKDSGYVSYLIQFALQTQAGDPQPWIACEIGLRRWASKPVKKTNWDRRVSVMLRLRQPRRTGWHFNPTMVRLRTKGDRWQKGKQTLSTLYWEEHVTRLLQRLQARELVEPDQIFSAPQEHMSTTQQRGDEYFIIHAEGMQPSHPVKSGANDYERQQIVQQILHTFPNVLREDAPLPIDEHVSLSTKQIRSLGGMRGEPGMLPLWTYDDMSDLQIVPRGSSQQEKVAARWEQTLAGLMRASDNRKIRILICDRTPGGKYLLEYYTRQFLFLYQNAHPAVELVPIAIPDVLGDVPPDTIPEKPPKSTRERAAYNQLLDNYKNDLENLWRRFLSQYKRDDALHLALIELDGNKTGLERDKVRYGWRKEAIRRACAQEDILSQIFLVLPPVTDMSSPKNYLPHKGELGRIKNGVKDLLLRQTHLLYGPPSDLYQYAGLTPETARETMVIGLYRHRSDSKSVDYPVVVRLHPDGRVDTILPEADGTPSDPIPYAAAGPMLGRNLIDGSSRKLNKRQLQHFALSIVTAEYGTPVLVMLSADDWRAGIIPTLKNPEMSSGQISIGNKTYTPHDLPDIRILRLREAGNLVETPQYLYARGKDWNTAEPQTVRERMILVQDQAPSLMKCYFSIGRQGITNTQPEEERLSIEVDGNEAYRQEQAVEIVPFFLQGTFEQQSGEALYYSRIVHLLRSSPAWQVGNTVLPFPLHLAKALIEDYLDVLS